MADARRSRYRWKDRLWSVRGGPTRLQSWTPTYTDDVDLAVEFQVVLERDSWVGLDRRAGAVERSVGALESLVTVPTAALAANEG